MSVWLPLALATIVRCLAVRQGGKGFRASEILKMFCLPELAAAMERDEAEQDRLNQATWFDQLAAMFGGAKIEEEAKE